MLAKKCQHDTMVLLFMLAITLAFVECRRELERLHLCRHQLHKYELNNTFCLIS